MPSLYSDEIAYNGNVIDKNDLDINPAITGELDMAGWK